MSRKSSQYRILFAVMALLSLTAGIAMAATGAASITYQGKLTDAAGNPLTGTYSVTFNIYSSSSGGTLLSTDTRSVTAENGLFTTTITIQDPTDVDGRALFLGITVGTDPEMTPRQSIRPVPYAISLERGAWIRSADVDPILNLLNRGGGVALNISTRHSNGDGILIDTTESGSTGVIITTDGTSSEGVRAQTGGVFGHGFHAVTSNDDSYGLYARTSGDESYGVNVDTAGTEGYGVHAATHGNKATGVDVSTEGSVSPGFNAATSGTLSDGIKVVTSGISSNGAYIRTKAAGSQGVNVSTTGKYADGVYVSTTGESAEGVHIQTDDQTATGLYIVAKGDDSTGAYIQTDLSYSDGLSLNTNGAYSDGANIHTNAAYSDGVDARTSAGNSKGLRAYTSGEGSEAAYLEAYGSGTDGLYVYSQYGDAIYARAAGTGGYAAQFRGNVNILSKSTGTSILELGEGLDYSEGFDVSGSEEIPPGTVLVISPDDPGSLSVSSEPYDIKVAGIVAGANGLGSAVKVGGDRFDANVALAGRVYCNVDATYGAVEPGSQLTTSATPGYAMIVQDPSRARGAILGKAMERLEEGQKGQILVLVTLQ